MTENEAKFLSEFFSLISKYNVTFAGTEEPVYICVGTRHIASIIEKDGNTSINVDVTLELTIIY